MCRTPWCFGECDECKAEEKSKKEWEESNTPCPHRKECKFEMVHIKQDRCTTCGKTFDY